MSSAPDFSAYRVLLLIERALFGAGDVAMTLRRHEALFTSHEAILPV
jgi:hypothetical protein